MVYITEFTASDGDHYGGLVEAETWADAQAYCVQHPRGSNETVLGELVATVRKTPDGDMTNWHNGFTPDDGELPPVH